MALAFSLKWCLAGAEIIPFPLSSVPPSQALLPPPENWDVTGHSQGCWQVIARDADYFGKYYQFAD